MSARQVSRGHHGNQKATDDGILKQGPVMRILS